MKQWNPRYIAYCADTGGLGPEATLARDAERWPGGNRDPPKKCPGYHLDMGMDGVWVYRWPAQASGLCAECGVAYKLIMRYQGPFHSPHSLTSRASNHMLQH